MRGTFTAAHFKMRLSITCRVLRCGTVLRDSRDKTFQRAVHPVMTPYKKIAGEAARESFWGVLGDSEESKTRFFTRRG